MNEQMIPVDSISVYTPENIWTMVSKVIEANKEVNVPIHVQGTFQQSGPGIKNENYAYAMLNGSSVNSSLRLYFSGKKAVEMYERLVPGRQYIFIGTLGVYTNKAQYFLQLKSDKVQNMDGTDTLPPAEDGSLNVETLTSFFIKKINRKHNIPLIVERSVRGYNPVRLALVRPNSETAEHDFNSAVNDLGAKFQVNVFKCNFTEPADMVARLKEADESDADLVLFVRGGGENLHIVDDLQVLQQVSDMKKPVITGLGHENDNLKVELLADKRCSTPSLVGTYLNDLCKEAYNSIMKDKRQKELEIELKNTRSYKPEPLFYGLQGTGNRFVRFILYALILIGLIQIISLLV